MRIRRKVISAVVVFLGVLGCGGGTGSGSGGGTTTTGSVDSALVGDWSILRETIYFDSGLTQQITPVTTILVLNASGAWEFGSSSGTWGASSIEDSDWTTWNIAAYGPTRKLVLNGWNNSTGTGPIDEPTGVVDNIWVVYDTTSEVNGPGKVWIEFFRR